LSTDDRSRSGGWLAVGAYSIWGLFPIYWKQIEFVPALELIAHRIAWSFLVLFPAVLSQAWTKAAWPDGSLASRQRRVLAEYALAGVLIAGNWFLYVWAVDHDFIVETSLGYFITPLLSVLLGVVFLGERLRPGQWIAVLLAVSGVAVLTLLYGAVPWIAIGLACTFSGYGLAKKRAPYAALLGLAVETGFLFLPAVVYLVILEHNGTGAFGRAGVVPTLLMAGSGVVTAVPLLMFAAAARRVPLSVLGIIQYISPTLQFLVGVFVYDEPFSREQFVGFSFVWAALVVFSAEAVGHARRNRLSGAS
jgi:chloramphenicol-sensitive protein RarD